ncbi:cytochrome c oxidase subunit 7A2, mitochondrial-like [Actinia tenebrosa]|uniref:Cytochrome c oxidase subunit 7A2, mitochondrial-like n=1 Tax=Actinia tenebrosa TaxID=6105 RepID=A0A6P8IE49_ACTTE|nr:cytochrome c oxidase subunit 7A2, mitochondrial-like [Actinia tenebrosa]
MFYKHNSFSGRVAASEAQATYHPEGFNTLKPTSATQVSQPASAATSESILNQIVKFQRIFQRGDAPIHLKKGAKDLQTYRGAMALSLAGLALTFFAIGQMATGTMKKKK